MADVCPESLQGHFQSAIKDYTKAVEINPMHSRAFYNRAFCYDRLHAYQEALADYTAALHIEPSATAYHNRGTVLERLGREEEALLDYAAAISADSSAHLTRHARCELLEDMG